MGEEMTKTLDQWTAECCKVTERKHKVTGDPVWYVGVWASTTTLHLGKWTIKDPGCWKVFIEWWISQTYNRSLIIENTVKQGLVIILQDHENCIDEVFHGENKWVDCITAIYEASQ